MLLDIRNITFKYILTLVLFTSYYVHFGLTGYYYKYE